MRGTLSGHHANASGNPLIKTDPLGSWSWNRWVVRQEWDKVGAIAGVVAVAAVVVGVTVVSGGTAAIIFEGVALSAGLLNTGVSAGGAVADCRSGWSSECGSSLAATGLSLFGFKASGLLKGTAWTARHVNESSRATARVLFAAANMASPINDAYNYTRNYCK